MWLETSKYLPKFSKYGFHKQVNVAFKTSDGREHIDIYQGYGIFGKGMGLQAPNEVTHWKPEPYTEITEDDYIEGSWS